jgi:hypothetical protein
MKLSTETIPIERYIGIDSHKHYVMVGGMSKDHKWTLRPRKVQMYRFRDWATKNLKGSDEVVLETNTRVLGHLRHCRPVGKQSHLLQLLQSNDE